MFSCTTTRIGRGLSRATSLKQFLHYCTTPEVEANIQEIRSCTDKHVQRKLKAKLLAILPAGEFKHNKQAKENELKFQITKPSGLVFIDVDELKPEEVQSVKKYLSDFDGCVGAKISARGVGVHAFIYVDQECDTPEKYEAVVNWIIANIDEKIRAKIDKVCRNIGRLCFLSYDPKPYYSESVEPCIIRLDEVPEKPKKAKVTASAPPPEPTALRLTNMRRLGVFFANKHPEYKHRENGLWYHWTDRWEELSDPIACNVGCEFIEQHWRTVAGKRVDSQKVTRARAEEMLYIAKGYATIEDEYWDRQRNVVGLPNSCCIELVSGEIRPQAREDYISATLPYYPTDNYSEDSTFHRLLVHTIPEPVTRTWLQRYVGQALLGKLREQKAVFLHGATFTGKSTLLEAICAAFGHLAKPMSQEFLLSKGTGDSPERGMYGLLGARLAFLDEIPERSKLDTGVFKRITTGGVVRVKQLYKDDYSARIQCSLMVSTNHMPYIKNYDPAVVRRMAIIPCENKITDVDVNIEDQIEKELGLVTRWILDGARDYLRHGMSPEPQVMKQRAEELYVSGDSIGDFIEKCVDIDENQQFSTKWRINRIQLWNLFCMSEASENTPLDYRTKKAFYNAITNSHLLKQRKIQNTWYFVGCKLSKIGEEILAGKRLSA